MSIGVILTVGNRLMGDDGAGPLLADRLEAEPAPGWIVIDGGVAPENVTHAVRAARPDRVLLVDAAAMGLEPGAIRRIDPADVARQSLFNTHVIPLDMLVDSLSETVPRVTFLGIQPGDVSFFGEPGAAVRDAIDRLHRHLVAGEDPDAWPLLVAEHVEPDVTRFGTG
jgi:hydrogenase 3 maturation protease